MSLGESTTKQLCRLCLRNVVGCVSIFSEYVDEEMVDLPKIVKRCLGIEVFETDGYTCMICSVCRRMVSQFNFFKTACLEAQYRLKEMPKWMSSGPRDPLEVTPITNELQKEDSRKDKMKGTDSRKFEAQDTNDSAVRPLAMWTLSEGCWRGTTVHREETIISDVLEDEQEEVQTPEKGTEGEIESSEPGKDWDMESQNTEAPSLGILDDHNYSSMTLGDEPLQMCSVVMDNADDGEVVLNEPEELADRTAEGSNQENEKDEDNDVIVEEDLGQHSSQSLQSSANKVNVGGPALKWQVMANGKVVPVRPSSIQKRYLFPKSKCDSEKSGLPFGKKVMVIKSSNPQAISLIKKSTILKEKMKQGKSANGKLLFKIKIPQNIKRIAINKHAETGNRIPVIRGSPRITPVPLPTVTSSPNHSILKLNGIHR